LANITKTVTKRIGATQYWDTSTDQNDTPAAIAAGDIFRIENSLGKPGRNMTIITGGSAISIRINSIITNYPSRNSQEFFNADWSNNISTGVEHKDTSQTPITIPASSTWEFNGEIPIRTVEIVTKGADFKLIVN
jgi:hypothetical protein